MLKGAHASAGAEGGEVQFVDLMTYVNDRLEPDVSDDRLARLAPQAR